MSNTLCIDYVSGSCPCQGEGFICGQPFYYRCRNNKWTLTIAENKPVEALIGRELRLYHKEGGDTSHLDLSAGNMTETKFALLKIYECYEDYKKEKNNEI